MLRMNGNLAATLALATAALTLAGCESVVEKVAETYQATLTGAEEVPGPGDPDGAGRAEVSVADKIDEFCYEIKNVTAIAPATMAHIHRGARGVAGPVVVTLETPTDGHSKGCPSVPEEIADEIEANPSNFYVNIHNAEYPDGAIRGQLMK